MSSNKMSHDYVYEELHAQVCIYCEQKMMILSCKRGKGVRVVIGIIREVNGGNSGWSLSAFDMLCF